MSNYNLSGWFVVDTETGGLDPTNTSLLTLSGIVLDTNFNTIKDVVPLELKIKHDVYKVTSKALDVNKINLCDHANGAVDPFKAGVVLYGYLLPYVNDKLVEDTGLSVRQRLGLIGHNVNFDKSFILNSELIRSWDRFFGREVLDTKIIAEYLKQIGQLPESCNTSLVDLADYFDLDTTGAHNSTVDMWLTVQVLRKLLDLDTQREYR